MTRQTGDIAITPERWAASKEREQAEIAANPQLAAMAKAHAVTKDEQGQLDAADATVAEAEAALNAAGINLDRARRGMAPIHVPDPKRPLRFFQRKPETYRAAKESLPGLEGDLAEARMQLQNAIRRRNATGRAIDQARAERRTAAKLKHAPKATPARPRNTGWGSMAAMSGWSGGPEGKS